MSRKRGNRSAKIKPQVVKKATRESRQSKAQLSSIGIEQVRRVVEYLKPIELSASNKFRTYQLMMLDDAIFSGVDSRKTLISRSQTQGYFRYNKNSEESKKVKDFFQWIMNNLEGQTPRSIGCTAAEMIANGVTLFEKVLRKGWDEYSDKWVLEVLSPIHPLTLNNIKPFNISPDGNKYLTLNQSASAFIGSDGLIGNIKFPATGIKEIDWNKVAYTSYASNYGQLLNSSPFDAAYTPWREKILLQELTNVGVTKDMAGMPVIEIPIDILDKAGSDENSSEARMVAGLQLAMANMHMGDQSYVVLPSDTQSETGNGARQYNLRFLGVEGGGKQHDLVALVEQRRRAILTILGANNLSTGESGGGSYNLLEGQSNIQAYYVERDNTLIEEMWNKQVFPQILRINEWKVKPEDMPVWESGDIQPASTDETSKAGQRSAAVGLLPKNDPKFLNEYYKKLGYDYRFDEDMSPDEVSNLTGDDVSRSSDGMRSGLPAGVGDAVGAKGDASTSNMEVVSKSSSLRMDSGGLYKTLRGKKVYLDDEVLDEDTLEVFK